MKGEPPRRGRDKRYGWFRCYSDFPTHPKWRMIALKARVSVSDVVAIALAMLAAANKGRPRGSIAEFSVEECSAALDIELDGVGRVYAALEEKGWIDQEYLCTWDERQPDKEDPTANERQKRRRAKLRAERHGVTTVTVTTRQDQTNKKAQAPVTHLGAARAEAQKGLANRENGENGENRPEAELWIAVEGVKIIAARCSIPPDTAKLKIVTWRNRAGRDPVVLSRILADADDQGLSGDGFQRTVEGMIDRHMRETKFGLPLPFPPKVVRGSGD